MKNILLPLFLFLIYSSVMTKQSNAQHLNWVKQFGGPDGTTYAKSVVTDKDNNVYYLGQFSGILVFEEEQLELRTTAQLSTFLLKYDSEGNLVWGTQFSGSSFFSSCEGVSLAVDENQNVFVAGQFFGTIGFGIDAHDHLSSPSNDRAVFYAKFNKDGKYVWSRQLDGIGNVLASCIKLHTDGEIYLAGKYDGQVDLDPSINGLEEHISPGVSQAFLIKLGPWGQQLRWAKVYGGVGFSEIKSMALDENGNVYTTGVFYGYTEFDPGVGDYSFPTGDYFDGFVTKHASYGKLIWANHLTPPLFSSIAEGHDIEIDKSGGISIVGVFGGTIDADFSSSENLLYSSVFKSFLITFLPSGDLIRSKVLHETTVSNLLLGTILFQTGINANLSIDDSGATYVTGALFSNKTRIDNSPSIDIYFPIDTLFRTYVTKVDALGDLDWTKEFSGVSFGQAIDENNNIYTAGTAAQVGDLDPGEGILAINSFSDGGAFLHKLSPQKNNLETSSIDFPVTVSPNPTSGPISVHLDLRNLELEAVTVTIRSILGQVISTTQYDKTNWMDLQIEGAPGTYLVDIRTPEGKSTTLKVVKH